MHLTALHLALKRAMRAYVRAVRRADEDVARRAFERVAGLSALLRIAASGFWPAVPEEAGEHRLPSKKCNCSVSATRVNTRTGRRSIKHNTNPSVHPNSHSTTGVTRCKKTRPLVAR